MNNLDRYSMKYLGDALKYFVNLKILVLDLSDNSLGENTMNLKYLGDFVIIK